MSDLTGKRFVVFGVASETSLAWAIVEELGARGATVALAFQPRFMSRVLQLVKGHAFIESHAKCDVGDEANTKAFFDGLSGRFDGLVHAVAFAPAEALGASILETKEPDFQVALGISAYSLVRVTRLGLPLFNEGASVVTLSYLGAERTVPGYRVMGTAKAALEQLVRELAASLGPMGHRVNAISAGPVKTLAASGVPGFDAILDWMAHASPLRRNVTGSDVARATRFLLSSDSAGITGQTLYVDAGYASVGVPPDLGRVLIEPELSPVAGPR